MKEELGVDLKPNSLQYLKIFTAQAHNKPEGIKVQMTCYTGEFDGEPQPNNEIEELMYLGSQPNVPVGPVDVLILDYLKKENLID